MTPPAPPRIFDRRRRASARARAAPGFDGHDFLHRRAMLDIVDRLETTTRAFPRALLFGVGALASLLTEKAAVGPVMRGDAAAARLGGAGIVFDEDANPLAEESLDLAVSLLTLHAVDDPVGALAQWRRALRPDGLFLGAAFGEETLAAWRAALYAAETELKGGVSLRIHPFASVRDWGAALQRAGFALPVVDLDSVEVRYEEASRLLADLKGMGETSALARRGAPAGRALLARALALFAQGGGVVRFDIVFLTGWAPHPAQQKALKPGSAKRSLADAVRAATPDDPPAD
ncbi:MAG: class I SAM-dependent methyltransferase [Parvularculaceae bacterium]|nr:class I SAM-dependent methyltransferase [Parvularculaceae bacterium]